MKQICLTLLILTTINLAAGEKSRWRLFSPFKKQATATALIPQSSVTTTIIEEENEPQEDANLSHNLTYNDSSSSLASASSTTESLSQFKQDDISLSESSSQFKQDDISLSESSGTEGKSIQDLLNNNLINTQDVVNLGSLNLVNKGLNSLAGLENVPGIERAISIDLQYNNLTHIPAHAFVAAKNLRTLLLSFNDKLISIDRNAFQGLDNLTHLVIENQGFVDNNGKKQIISLEPGLFDSLPALQYVNLSGNIMPTDEIERIKGEIHDAKRKGPTTSSAPTVSVKIVEPTSLENFYRSAITKNPAIAKMFGFLENPELLGSFTTQPGTFSVQDLIDLHAIPAIIEGTLDLSNNNISRLNGLQHIPGIANVRTLKLNNNKIANIPGKAFDGFDNLDVLDLSDNRISNIDLGGLAGLAKLRVINLERNNLTNIEIWYFNSTGNLRSIWLAGNKLKTVSPHAFFQLKNLTTLDLSNNELSHVPSQAFNIRVAPNEQAKLKMIDLNKNRLSQEEQAIIRNDVAQSSPDTVLFMDNQR